MPNDLLLPAFVLTLIANAILVAVAIRALSRGRDEHDEPVGRTEWPANRPVAPSVTAESWPPPDPEPTETAPAIPASAPTEARGSKPVRHRRRGADPAAAPPPPRKKRSKPVASSASAESRSAPSTDDVADPGRATPAPPNVRPAGRRGSRRKFSLPPPEDQDRVNRSIETFLSSGAETVEPSDPAGASATTDPTTIAVVAIDGVDRPSASADPSVSRAVDAAVATLDQALRAAARAGDQVVATGTARFRIVLPATGELAARAFLRRVRATVESSLDASDLPLELVTATTTVLDEPIEAAAARADARLDATLSARARQAAGGEPRVAGD